MVKCVLIKERTVRGRQQEKGKLEVNAVCDLHQKVTRESLSESRRRSAVVSIELHVFLILFQLNYIWTPCFDSVWNIIFLPQQQHGFHNDSYR